jgi:pimeloyl-ACP methyl ester carboxylesterase
MPVLEAVLDNPEILRLVFQPNSSRFRNCKNAIDGSYSVEEDIHIAYRYHPSAEKKAVFIIFHGNSENVSDYDPSIHYFHNRLEASVLVVEFRGYGRSTGSPKLTKLLSDAEALVPELPSILAESLDLPWILLGRSMGSSCAVHLATKYIQHFAGLVIDSGFTDLRKLPMVEIISGHVRVDDLPDPFRQCDKLGSLQVPLLVLHGERDRIAPVSMGQDLHDAVPHTLDKFGGPYTLAVIKRFENAGHNDLMEKNSTHYFESLEMFHSKVVAFREEFRDMAQQACLCAQCAAMQAAKAAQNHAEAVSWKLPSKPLAAAGYLKGGKLFVSFRPPSANGGAEVIKYVLTNNSSGDTLAVTSSRIRQLVIDNWLESQPLSEMSICAVNVEGQGPGSVIQKKSKYGVVGRIFKCTTDTDQGTP